MSAGRARIKLRNEPKPIRVRKKRPTPCAQTEPRPPGAVSASGKTTKRTQAHPRVQETPHPARPSEPRPPGAVSARRENLRNEPKPPRELRAVALLQQAYHVILAKSFPISPITSRLSYAPLLRLEWTMTLTAPGGRGSVGRSWVRFVISMREIDSASSPRFIPAGGMAGRRPLRQFRDGKPGKEASMVTVKP
jgi:hypothetical protein